jgi:hypothetical protein
MIFGKDKSLLVSLCSEFSRSPSNFSERSLSNLPILLNEVCVVHRGKGEPLMSAPDEHLRAFFR